MATSGGEAKIDDGNEETFEWNCKICQEEDDIIKEAVAYCTECNKCFCKDCLRHHNRHVKKHKVLDQEYMNSWGTTQPTILSQIDIECAYHPKQPVMLYCGYHDEVCCPLCALKSHSGNCKETIVPISSAANSTSAEDEYNNVQQDIRKRISKFSELENDISSYQTNFLSSRDRCESCIVDFVGQLINSLRRLQTESLAKTKDLYDEYFEKIKHDLHVCSITKDSLISVETQLDKLHAENDIESFIKMKIYKKSLSGYKEKEESLSSRREHILSFMINEEFLQLFKSNHSLGNTAITDTRDKETFDAYSIGKGSSKPDIDERFTKMFYSELQEGASSGHVDDPYIFSGQSVKDQENAKPDVAAAVDKSDTVINDVRDDKKIKEEKDNVEDDEVKEQVNYLDEGDIGDNTGKSSLSSGDDATGLPPDTSQGNADGNSAVPPPPPPRLKKQKTGSSKPDIDEKCTKIYYSELRRPSSSDVPDTPESFEIPIHVTVESHTSSITTLLCPCEIYLKLQYVCRNMTLFHTNVDRLTKHSSLKLMKKGDTLHLMMQNVDMSIKEGVKSVIDYLLEGTDHLMSNSIPTAGLDQETFKLMIETSAMGKRDEIFAFTGNNYEILHYIYPCRKMEEADALFHDCINRLKHSSVSKTCLLVLADTVHELLKNKHPSIKCSRMELLAENKVVFTISGPKGKVAAAEDTVDKCVGNHAVNFIRFNDIKLFTGCIEQLEEGLQEIANVEDYNDILYYTNKECKSVSVCARNQGKADEFTSKVKTLFREHTIKIPDDLKTPGIHEEFSQKVRVLSENEGTVSITNEEKDEITICGLKKDVDAISIPFEDWFKEQMNIKRAREQQVITCDDETWTFPTGYCVVVTGRSVEKVEKDVIVKMSPAVHGRGNKGTIKLADDPKVATLYIPEWKDGKLKEKKTLTCHVGNLLEESSTYDCFNIAFVVTDKTCGWQFSKLIKNILYAVKEFFEKKDNLSHTKVVFVCQSTTVLKECYDICKNVLSSYKREGSLSVDDKNSQQGAGSKAPRRHPSEHEKQGVPTSTAASHQFPHCLPATGLPSKNDIFTCICSETKKLLVYASDIFSMENADMMVCGENISGKGKGFLSNRLSEIGGKNYQQAKERAFKFATHGDVIVCKAGSNPYKFIAHVVLPKNTEIDDEQKMIATFDNLFSLVKEKNCHSVALPLLGTGKGKVDTSYCAQMLFRSMMNFCKNHPKYVVQVHLINIEPEKTNMIISTIQQCVGSMLDQHKTPPKRSPPPSTKQSERYPPSITKLSVISPQSDTTPEEIPKSQANKKKCIGKILKESSAISRGVSGSDQSFSREYNQDKPQTIMFSARGVCGETSDDDADDDDFGFKTNKTSSVNDIESSRRTGLEDKKKGEKQGNIPITEYPSPSDSIYIKKKDFSSLVFEDMENSEESRQEGDTREDCVICMDEIKDPKVLPCGHKFCVDCIDAQFRYDEICPICGAVCGVITGDQPEGTMDVYKNKYEDCSGYEGSGRIEITYRMPNGQQKSYHPSPGMYYRGITRKAYLPDNRKGRKILAMLRIAFDRRLIFTIGSSRTSGLQGVITWNDIHHKTDPKPHGPFGYPDPTYLERVVDELKAKGITEADIQPSGSVLSTRR